MRLLPSSPEEGVELWSVEVEAITVGREEGYRLVSCFPAPGFSVEAFDNSKFGLHRRRDVEELQVTALSRYKITVNCPAAQMAQTTTELQNCELLSGRPGG